MKTIWLTGFVVLLHIAGSTFVSARGMLAPPPRYFGGNTGGWIGDGGSGPIFGFDDPWGKDFPFGGGSLNDPGFTGWIDGGEWTRGGGPLSSGGGSGDTPGTGSGDSTLGCRNICERPTMVGPCLAACWCRDYMHDTGRIICDKKIVPGLSNGSVCNIYLGGCDSK